MVKTIMGVDGCRAGWCAFLGDSAASLKLHVFADLDSLWKLGASCRMVLIDVPIGLPSGSHDAKRECDLAARACLGSEGQSRVFFASPRAAVYADSYELAKVRSDSIVGFKPSIQAWNIFKKIREVDEFLHRTPEARGVLRECHPEVCFWSLCGEVLQSKKGKRGQPNSRRQALDRRMSVLSNYVPDIDELVRSARSGHKKKSVQDDDILDALVAAITALAPPEELRTLPPNPPLDAHGLRVEMVYRAASVTPASR